MLGRVEVRPELMQACSVVWCLANTERDTVRLKLLLRIPLEVAKHCGSHSDIGNLWSSVTEGPALQFAISDLPFYAMQSFDGVSKLDLQL